MKASGFKGTRRQIILLFDILTSYTLDNSYLYLEPKNHTKLSRILNLFENLNQTDKMVLL